MNLPSLLLLLTFMLFCGCSSSDSKTDQEQNKIPATPSDQQSASAKTSNAKVRGTEDLEATAKVSTSDSVEGDACPDADQPEKFYVLTGVEVFYGQGSSAPAENSTDSSTVQKTSSLSFDVMPRFEIDEDATEDTSVPTEGTCGGSVILNPTPIGGEVSITFDKAIKHKGEVVPPGTNLLKFARNESIDPFNTTEIHMFPLSPFAGSSVSINSNFEIPADHYKITFAWKTSRGETIATSVEVYINVDMPQPYKQEMEYLEKLEEQDGT